MIKKDVISFQASKLKSLTPAIKRKQEELGLITKDCINLRKESNELREKIKEQTIDFDKVKKDITKERVDFNKEMKLALDKLSKLQEQYNTDTKSFAGKIKNKKTKLSSLKDSTDQLEKQIKPILEVELLAFEAEKEKIEKEIAKLKKTEKTTKKITDDEYKKYKELVINNEKEEKKLDKKLAEVSLREAADKKLNNILVMHTRRINRIYQKLGKDKLVITI